MDGVADQEDVLVCGVTHELMQYRRSAHVQQDRCVLFPKKRSLRRQLVVNAARCFGIVDGRPKAEEGAPGAMPDV